MAKPVNPRLLGARRKQREARAKAYERALMGWLNGYRSYQQRLAMDRLTGKFAKITKDEWFDQQLNNIMNMHGLREFGDSANDAAGAYIIQPSLITAASRNKPTQIKWFYEWRQNVETRVRDIMQTTQDNINAQVNALVTEALGEIPMPSAGEVARRIRTQAFSTDNHVFSSERAALIARTELTQAQNSGTFEGYKATGVKRVRWLAYSDGKSGDRHHERMNRKVINVGDRFETPLGNEMRFPGDPRAPIKETANCRCTLAPVI